MLKHWMLITGIPLVGGVTFCISANVNHTGRYIVIEHDESKQLPPQPHGAKWVDTDNAR